MSNELLIEMLKAKGHTEPEIGAETVAKVFEYNDQAVIEEYVRFGMVGQKAPGHMDETEWWKDRAVKQKLTADARNAIKWWKNFKNFYITKIAKQDHELYKNAATSILNNIARSTVNPMNLLRDLAKLYDKIFGAGSSNRAGHFMNALGFASTLQAADVYGFRVPEL